MKKLLIFITIVNMYFGSLLGQQSIIVEFSDDLMKFARLEGDHIQFTNSDFIDFLAVNNVTELKKAFPASRSEKLANVFEILSSDDSHQLLQSFAKQPKWFINPEIAPIIEPLVETNDYSTAFEIDYALDLINAKGAWNYTTGSRRIKIAISDSNFDLNHEELVGKYSYVHPNLINSNVDHGTAVAITAAGNTNNGVGKSAIGYDSDLMLYGMSYNNLLLASYAGADIINASWAGGCSYSQYYQDLIDEVLSNGSIIVAAAGNGGTCGGASNLVYPASYRGVISVSSIGPNDNHESVVGNSASTHQHNEHVDIVAPGYNVNLGISNNVYVKSSGTSFASPLVAGTVGLMLNVNDRLNHCEVEYLLKTSAQNIDSINLNYTGLLGAGRLDAEQALALTLEYNETSIGHSINHNYLEPDGALSFEIESDLSIATYDYDFIGYTLINDSTSYLEYEFTIEYSTGCVYKTNHYISESEFFSNDSLLVLPVTLISMSAQQVGNEIEIKWEIASEENCAFYLVEKSTNGLEWTDLGTVETGQHSGNNRNYSLIDKSPTSGIQYYRLKQFDYNGTNSTLSVADVNYSNLNSEAIKLYPNPTNGYSKLEILNENISRIDIVDMQGRIIYTQENEFVKELDGTRFGKGLYSIIGYTNNGEKTATKWIIE